MLYLTMKNKWIRMLTAMAGAVLYGIGVNLFLVPLDLYTGGIMGICQLIRTLIYQAMGVTGGYDFSGILYYLFNVPIFLLAFRYLGKDFLCSSLLCITTYTLTVSLVPIPASPLVGDILTGCLLGGAVIAEQIFGLPGFGSAILEAINKKETMVVLGATVFLSLLYMLIMLAMDLINALLNPKIRDNMG